jgi:hypothetical protein
MFTNIIKKQIELNDSIISNWRDQLWAFEDALERIRTWLFSHI